MVDLSHQYINGLMYLLTQPDGSRPALVDDRNFYFSAGVKEWVRRKFLNDDIKVPLGIIGSLRTQLEATAAVAEPFSCRRGHGSGGVDSRHDQPAGSDRRSEIQRPLRTDAGL